MSFFALRNPQITNSLDPDFNKVDRWGYPWNLWPHLGFTYDNWPSDQFLADNHALPLYKTTAFDETLFKLSRLDHPVIDTDSDGREYARLYEVVALTAEELDQRKKSKAMGFDYAGAWSYLRRTTAYSRLKEAAKVDLALNTELTELIAVFGQAIAGHVDYEAVQSCISSLLLADYVSQDDYKEIVGVLSNFGLDSFYQLPTPSPTEEN